MTPKSKVKSQKSKVGFTLVEIMVVIALIGILAGFLLVSMQGARASARDAQRQADLENIKSALEMYKSSCGQYPDSVPTNGSALSGTCNGTPVTVLSSTPKDPTSPSRNYTYALTSTKKSYTLTAEMELEATLVVTP